MASLSVLSQGLTKKRLTEALCAECPCAGWALLIGRTTILLSGISSSDIWSVHPLTESPIIFHLDQ
jgi:hypothetical protein